jgi:thioredoxin reductase
MANWTKDLTLYTNGKSTLTEEQTLKLQKHNINIVETEIEKLDHNEGNLQYIIFKDGKKAPVKAIYARSAFVQHSSIPELLGCDLTEEGYLKVDALQKTNVEGVFACGDNTSRIRTVANAVATGTTAGMMVNKEMVLEEFN